MKYPNMLYTAFLSAILVVPFAISFVAPVLEPYPAVLLPSGADRIKVAEDQMDFERTAIYGRVTGHEAWIRLSPSEFLFPVPPQYFPLLAQRYFGLSPVVPVAERTKVGFLITINTRKFSEEEVNSSKQWLRARLKESGCDDDVLRITQEVVTVRRSTGKEISIRYQNDKVFALR
jgi:hypothetical protein